jgi:hypothetical protein
MMRKILVLAGFLLLLSVGTASAQDDMVVDTAWQPFEHGVMMWFAETDTIWVFQATNTALSGRLSIYRDSWTDTMGNPSANPPAGRFTPQRGFGQVWQALGGSGSALGWALAPELGYDSNGFSQGDDNELVVDGPGDTVYGITISSDGGSAVWRTIDIG